MQEYLFPKYPDDASPAMVEFLNSLSLLLRRLNIEADDNIRSIVFKSNIGFYNTAAIAQPVAIDDATNADDVILQLNKVLVALRSIGIIAT
jgi:hypothetical protein